MEWHRVIARPTARRTGGGHRIEDRIPEVTLSQRTSFADFRSTGARRSNYAGPMPYLIEEEQFRVALNLIAHVEQLLHVVGERSVGFRRQCQGIVAEGRAKRGERVLPAVKGLLQRLESCQQERC